MYCKLFEMASKTDTTKEKEGPKASVENNDASDESKSSAKLVDVSRERTDSSSSLNKGNGGGNSPSIPAMHHWEPSMERLGSWKVMNKGKSDRNIFGGVVRKASIINERFQTVKTLQKKEQSKRHTMEDLIL